MAEFFNPDGVAKPQAEYSHGVIVPEGQRLLYIAGQIGVTPEGELRDGIEAQAAQAFQNLVAVLAGASLGPENLIKIQLFLLEQEYLSAVEAARNAALGDAKPASTLLVVKALARPGFLFEVEGVAAG